jgi:hypothetical protein
MTNDVPALTLVCPHTSSSLPKSFISSWPSTDRHWFVWLCSKTMGAPAVT